MKIIYRCLDCNKKGIKQIRDIRHRGRQTQCTKCGSFNLFAD